MLPGIDGLEVCRRLREGDPNLPVVMLTAPGRRVGPGGRAVAGRRRLRDEAVLAAGTGAAGAVGAAPRVASGRARAAEVLRDGDLVVDVARRVARLGGAELALTVREFDLLVFLMRNPGRAFRRSDLLEAVWGWTFGDQSTVTVHMRRLREKIEVDPATPAGS